MPVISSSNPFSLTPVDTFDTFKVGWKFSGVFGTRANAPTTVNGDSLFNSSGFTYNDSSWSTVDISSGASAGSDDYYAYCRKKFYYRSGTYTFSGNSDDEACWGLVPSGSAGTIIQGDIAVIAGNGTESFTNHSFTVTTSGIYYLTGRFVEGSGGDLIKLTAHSNLQNVFQV